MKVCEAPAGILYFCMKPFEKSLLPSSLAPEASGPTIFIFLRTLSFLKKSTIPRTKGSSGPTITISILFSFTALPMASKSFTPIGKLVAICAVPALPGATKRFVQFFDCAIFQAKVCSRPPEPSIRIFIEIRIFVF